MVEMKRGEVVLSLAAQLASWRAVLVLVRTWATCKPWQRKDFHQYSIFLADYLNQSQQTVWESVGAAAVTESRKVDKGRRKRRYADVDGHGKSEPELGPRGPTLKKQSKQTVLESAGGATATESRKVGKGRPKRRYVDVEYFLEEYFLGEFDEVIGEAMDPAGSPSSIPKVADTTRSSSSADGAATVSSWQRFFCLGKGK